MSTSYIVGLVLARSSVGLLRLRGVIRKYKKDAARLMQTITSRFFPEDLSRVISLTPSPRPRPNIGPIRGDMSIAPITTGMELTFRPMEAMIVAIARIQAFGPLKYMLPLIAFSAASVSMYPAMFTVALNKVPISLNNPIFHILT